MNYTIEICANSVQSAAYAEVGGAHRLELCDNLWEGGTTPSIGTIRHVVKMVSIPVYVLIRPRGGDFTYGQNEFEIMKEDIHAAKEAGAAGIVSGVLTTDGQVDIVKTASLVSVADPLPFTFHRAFDLVNDPKQSLEDLISAGAHRLLTSGSAENALDGIGLIEDLIEQASGRITIMPGGGIHPGNVQTFYAAGCREFHLSAKSYVQTESIYMGRVPMNGLKAIPEEQIYVSNPQIIESLKEVLDEMQ